MTNSGKEPAQRTIEIEEKSNLYFFVPLSHWLVPPLAFLKITPNMVSLTGMLVGIGAAVSYFHFLDYRFALLGLLLMAICHVLDGADGALARHTNSQSDFGKVVDGICDYIVYGSVYVALTLALVPEYGPSIWFIMAIAAICHAFQAGAYELQRQEYEYWGYGKKSAELPDLVSLNDMPTELSFFGRLAAFLANIYAHMQYKFSGLEPDFRPALKKFLAENPEKTDQFRAEYREKFAPIVKRWGIMCANYRTYAIFIACISQQPILYFGFEITFLNLALIWLVYKQKRYNRAFLQQINA